ncbi:hypothetical protein AN958_00787 [Leucoagaricus sp. SymC.cos]|nr:hypothetical protein AN958_00787 [Leucoagaricus sp. SymC.cos]
MLLEDLWWLEVHERSVSCVLDFEKRFRNVSVITQLNTVKDEINRLGSLRFAAETGQELVDFFSIDTIAAENTTDASAKKHRSRQKLRRHQAKRGNIPLNIQKVLWDQPACSNTKLIPAKLSLCIGMPMMIRNNAATDLCITKGQEAVVCGWQAVQGINGVRSLDTLFVRLQNPPMPVMIDGLPQNVVPLTRTSVTTCCSLPDDSSITISRSQVEVLPNFAMTEYASQGKTRENNVVDLTYSRSHQGYYTALSRGVSTAGTLILSGIHPSKITGGASGALRQEFREIEILDDITIHRFENKLPAKVAMADRRNPLITLFRAHKGVHYMPSGIHSALKWNKRDPFLEREDSEVEIVSPKQRKAQDIKPVDNMKEGWATTPSNNEQSEIVNFGVRQPNARTLKRSSDAPEPLDRLVVKKPKMDHTAAATRGLETSMSLYLNVPIGTQWRNNSCAYDAICTILFNAWREDPDSTTLSWHELQNDLLDSLTADFKDCHATGLRGSMRYSLEQVRDRLRQRMVSLSDEFAFGQYASTHEIMEHLLASSSPIMKSVRHCPNEHVVDGDERVNMSCEIVMTNAPAGYTVQQYVDNFAMALPRSCSYCEDNLVGQFSFT